MSWSVLKLIVFISTLNFISCQVYNFHQAPSNHSKKGQALEGHSLKSFDGFVLVTQCSLACLKLQNCLSYNFDSLSKKCDLNSATHLTQPSSLKSSPTNTYYLREAFTIDLAADPCLTSPCKNGGTCLSRSDNGRTCFCSALWTGPSCESKVDIAWSEWSQWSSCSQSCGEGMKKRTRKCMDGNNEVWGGLSGAAEWCGGSAQDIAVCKVKECPYWDKWTAWTDCSTSKTCGEGVKSRSRNCVHASADSVCQGIALQNATCLSIECDASVTILPFNDSLVGTFGEGFVVVWSQVLDRWLQICYRDWRQENADIVCKKAGFSGGAFKSSGATYDDKESIDVSFNCAASQNGLLSCPHSDWSLNSCNQRVYMQCVVDGRWSAWSSWSECSVSCANGEKTRTRTCSFPAPKNNGAACLGESVEKMACEEGPCPVDAYWQAWQQWSECSVSCGGGSQNRKRFCTPAQFDGKECEGENEQHQDCSPDPCPVDGVWNEWQSWSECDATCGGGHKTRGRYCVEPLHGGSECSGDSQETSDCNTDPCPIDGFWNSWGEWSSCSVTCGGGKRIRTRDCTPPQHGGADCPSDGGQSEEFCNDDPCIIDGQWSLWSRWLECSVTCGGGKERRYRECSKPKNGGSTCEGSPEEFRDCNLPACPTPAEWTEWSEWSRCSKTCGDDGVRTRSRECPRTEEGPNSLPCLNSNFSTDFKDCNRFDCLPYVSSCQDAFNRGLEEDSYVDALFIGSTSSTPTRVKCSNQDLKVTTTINTNFETSQSVAISNSKEEKNYRLVYSSDGVQTSTEDLRTLVYNSKDCKQYVSWRCKNFPMNSQQSTKLVYWKNKYSEQMKYWGGASNDVTKNGVMCKCGEDGTCSPQQCRCDAGGTDWLKDDGYITNKFDLPITEFVATGNGSGEQEGEFEIGPLICS